MLSLKKVLWKLIATAHPKLELSTMTNSADISLPASNSTSVTIDLARTGYTLIGIVGVKTSGAGSSLGFLYSFAVSGPNAVLYFRNSTSTARSFTVGATGLYMREV